MISWSSLLIPSLCGVAAALSPESYIIPAGQQSCTNVTWDTTVGLRAFDGPHISCNNGNAFQWWYFDAVSSNSDAAVVVQYYPGWEANASYILFNAVYPNGTNYQADIQINGALRLDTIQDGSQGYAEDGSISWIGAPDLSSYSIHVHVPEWGIEGSISLVSTAPPHVPSGPKVDGASYIFDTNFAWANEVPDSIAVVDFNLNGTKLAFSGNAYHDQNWGPESFFYSITEWYWGHAHVGDYSLVWFYYIDITGAVKSNLYLSENGQILLSGFSLGTVTPVGNNLHSPTRRDDDITGWQIELEDASQNNRYSF